MADTSKDEPDLLGDDDVETFSRSQADHECAAENLFSSPPRPNPYILSVIFKNSTNCPTHPRHGFTK